MLTLSLSHTHTSIPSINLRVGSPNCGGVQDCEPIIKYFMQQRDLARKAERGYLMEHDAPVASGDALLQEERQADVRMKVGNPSDIFATIYLLLVLYIQKMYM